MFDLSLMNCEFLIVLGGLIVISLRFGVLVGYILRMRFDFCVC